MKPGYHHYGDCVSCLSGDICHDSDAHPSYMQDAPRPGLIERFLEWLISLTKP